MATETVQLDEAKVEAFMEKVIGDFSGAMTTVLTAIGDKLGLFKDLAEHGPATSSELAERARVDERYAREWLHGLYAAGYLEHDRADGRFSLPPEHQPAFAQEGGPLFLCGGYQEFYGALGVIPKITEAFKTGGGARRASTPTTSGQASAASPPAGTRTISCRSGSRRCRKFTASWRPAAGTRTSAAARDWR